MEEDEQPFAEDEEDRAAAVAGRVCSEPGCVTVLSVYNASDRCNRHPHYLIPIQRTRRR